MNSKLSELTTMSPDGTGLILVLDGLKVGRTESVPLPHQEVRASLSTVRRVLRRSSHCITSFLSIVVVLLSYFPSYACFNRCMSILSI